MRDTPHGRHPKLVAPQPSPRLRALPWLALVMLLTHTASAAEKRIAFAGRDWIVKESAGAVGPGPNRFSAADENVHVDQEGHLHLAISLDGGEWRCAEVITDEPVGYGDYEYRVGPGIDRLDPNVVLGFFTWNSDSWKTDSNSEIDIELTRWSKAEEPNLHYSVHPNWGVRDILHAERYHARQVDLGHEGSTHTLRWTPSRVELATYRGDQGPAPERLVASWSYDDTNPPRQGVGPDGLTDPLVIPRPREATNARINLWLFNGDRQGGGDPPTNRQPVKVVVTGFKFTPLALPE